MSMQSMKNKRSHMLSVRLSESDSRLLSNLCRCTGLCKSQLARRALTTLFEKESLSDGKSLFDLGENRFGRYASNTRQSANIKRMVRARF
jgi:hypothetical protein